jgi:hypothetical protein
MFTAGCLDGGNVFVSPAPEFDMPKTGGSDARNFLLCQELGIQGLKANGGCHKFSWSLQWSDSEAHETTNVNALDWKRLIVEDARRVNIGIA